jgi:nicotinate-nucleotide adenylyltransferase
VAAPVTRRIGILGGTFDPIHTGHVDAASAAQAELDLAEVWIVPSHVPPHRPQPSASSYHRFAMAALVVATRPGWRVSDVELLRSAPSYTSDTLEWFHGRNYAPDDLVFIVGTDAFLEIETWHAYPQVLDAANFAVVSRPGSPATTIARRVPSLAPRIATALGDRAETSIVLIDRRTADVSATAIRRLIASGGSPAGLVPDAVAQHIERHRLYASAPPEPEPRPATPRPQADRLHGKS